MSMDTCSRCSRPVDTDFDLDCYLEVGNMRSQTYTVCICEPCRDKQELDDAKQAAMDPS